MYIKKITVITLFVLLSSSIFLSACGQTTEQALAADGLRDTSVTTAQEMETDLQSSISLPTNLQSQPIANQPVNARQGTTNDDIGQARTADRAQHNFDPANATPLTAAEIESLLYMREEEKLAHDVYQALYEQWNLPVFQNIAASEDMHTQSILFLMDLYEIEDPAADLGAGEFTIPVLQTMYGDLLAQGSTSLAGALTVGATIEDLDIFDLQTRLAQTENADIIQVFNNLLAGSENHLRAFVGQLERQTGETYQPQFIDLETYQAIMSGSNGNGNGQGGNGNGSGRGQGGNGNGQGGNGNGYGNGTGRGNGNRGSGQGITANNGI